MCDALATQPEKKEAINMVLAEQQGEEITFGCLCVRPSTASAWLIDHFCFSNVHFYRTFPLKDRKVGLIMGLFSL